MPDIKEYFEDPSGVREGIETQFRKTKGKVRRKAIKTEGTTRRNIDYSPEQFQDLEDISKELGITSQAIVKIALQQFIDDFFEKKKRKMEIRSQKEQA